jgi:hypothetical protein
MANRHRSTFWRSTARYVSKNNFFITFFWFPSLKVVYQGFCRWLLAVIVRHSKNHKKFSVRLRERWAVKRGGYQRSIRDPWKEKETFLFHRMFPNTINSHVRSPLCCTFSPSTKIAEEDFSACQGKNLSKYLHTHVITSNLTITDETGSRLHCNFWSFIYK